MGSPQRERDQASGAVGVVQEGLGQSSGQEDLGSLREKSSSGGVRKDPRLVFVALVEAAEWERVGNTTPEAQAEWESVMWLRSGHESLQVMRGFFVRDCHPCACTVGWIDPMDKGALAVQAWNPIGLLMGSSLIMCSPEGHCCGVSCALPCAQALVHALRGPFAAAKQNVRRLVLKAAVDTLNKGLTGIQKYRDR